MFGIVLSAINSALGFLLRAGLIKFVVYFALYYVTVEFIYLLAQFLPNSDALWYSLRSIPSSVWYFFDMFRLSVGIPVLLSAWSSRFIIRRLPVIG